MKLTQLISPLRVLEFIGNPDIEISSLCFDSRKARPGSLFVALKGVQSDGHDFIGQAIAAGAVCIVSERDNTWPEAQAFVKVADSAEALGLLATEWHRHPARHMQVIGVTGTNGKTTVTDLLHRLFMLTGHPAGLIGTVENRIGDQRLPSQFTTPDPLALQALLAQMRDSGCRYVFMEVSSHALAQRRVAGIPFAGAAFTNLTHDHLDYHGSFDRYRDAKKLLFDGLDKSAFALINADDRNGRFMLQNCKAKPYAYALKNPADFKVKIIENTLQGLCLHIDGRQMHSRLVGDFNALNIAAVYGIATLCGIPSDTALTALSSLDSPDGRFDLIYHPTKNNCVAVIDYAHTPDALEKVLETLHKTKCKEGRIITVVGCGGDRDKAKRSLMARAAARLSAQVILTSDNPRSESPGDIIRDMEAGLEPAQRDAALSIESREQAIKTACTLAQPGDVVLIAGKGHEKYQEIMGVKHPFDDKEMVRRYFFTQTTAQ